MRPKRSLPLEEHGLHILWLCQIALDGYSPPGRVLQWPARFVLSFFLFFFFPFCFFFFFFFFFFIFFFFSFFYCSADGLW